MLFKNLDQLVENIRCVKRKENIKRDGNFIFNFIFNTLQIKIFFFDILLMFL